MAIVNALLVRWRDGWHTVEDAASIAANGRKEGFLQLGTLGSTDTVDAVCAALFESMAEARVATTMSVHPTGAGDRPHDDWRKGDFITAPAAEGGASSQRVLALTTAEDEHGNPQFVPELRALAQVEGQRIERWLKRLANGALGGTVEAATPLIFKGGPEGPAPKTPAALGSAVLRTTNQTIPTNSWTPLVFDTVEFDTLEAWDASNPSRLTALKAGMYQLGAATAFAINPTGSRGLRVVRNGSEVLFTTQQNAVTDPTLWSHVAVSNPWPLDPGDYITAEAWQSSGGNLALDSATGGGTANQRPRLAMSQLTQGTV